MDYKVGDRVYLPAIENIGAWTKNHHGDLRANKSYIIGCIGKYNFDRADDNCVGLDGSDTGWIPVEAIRPWSEHPSQKLGWHKFSNSYRKVCRVIDQDTAEYEEAISDIYLKGRGTLNHFKGWTKIEDLTEIQKYLPDGHPDKVEVPVPLDIIAEAKEKYPVSTKYKCTVNSGKQEILEGDEFRLVGKDIYIYRKANVLSGLYRQDRWAEIIEPSTGALTKEQLIEEAKKRGYVPEAQFLDLVHNAKFTIDSVGEFQNFKDPTQLYVAVKYNTLGNKTGRIYKKGVWAKLLTNSTPIQAQKADILQYPVTPKEAHPWNPRVGDYATCGKVSNCPYWTGRTFKITEISVSKLGTFLYNGDGTSNADLKDCRPATSAEVLKLEGSDLDSKWKWSIKIPTPELVHILEEENVMDTSVKRIQALTTHLVEETETIYF